MNNRNSNTRKLAASGVIAAVYAVLTMALAPISYGAIQFRISEAMCILPFFIPSSAMGLFLGCAIANIMTGNIFDVIFGSLATLCAGLITAWLGKKSHSIKNAVLACLMPVIFNALIIGAVITTAYSGLKLFDNFGVFALNAAYVGLGEAGVMFFIGLPLIVKLKEKKFFTDWANKING